jgi:hypothetical protein
LFQPKRYAASFGDGPRIICLMCGHDVFAVRNLKMNTGTAEFLGFAWAESSATALICELCTFVQQFADGRVLSLERVKSD